MNVSKLGLAAALAGLTIAAVPAQAEVTAATLVDRANIEDLLSRYYYNLGHSSPDSLGMFYTDDAEMILGTTSYKGKAGIEGAYKGLANADIPQRKSFSFNVLLSNPLVTVHGNTATARIIFTEVIIDKKGDAPRILVQGKEFDSLAKVKGQWRFTKREIRGAEQGPPDGWKD